MSILKPKAAPSVSNMAMTLCDNFEAVVGAKPEMLVLSQPLLKRLREELTHNDAIPIVREFYGMRIVVNHDGPDIFTIEVAYEDSDNG